MPLDNTLDIAVISSNKNNGKIMIASIVAEIVNKTSSVNGYDVIASIREKGKELLFGSEEVKESLKASERADSYSLKTALLSADNISNTVNISFVCRNPDIFCGRVHFHCESDDINIDPSVTDAVLLVTDKDNKQQKLSMPENIPVVAAVYCESEPENININDSFGAMVSESIYNTVKSRRCFLGWYNPYGFNDGKLNSAENASPFGIYELFWKLMNLASERGKQYYQNIVSESLKTISSRRSVFQRDSRRRVMELEEARKKYAHSVDSLYAIEQLSAITEKKTLY
ncbi:MAG: hypothetical protein NC177_12400 [Ruminococcus flavefaciens]|nr:hypothetical protein [Ruminococcus flavefaciens]